MAAAFVVLMMMDDDFYGDDGDPGDDLPPGVGIVLLVLLFIAIAGLIFVWVNS